MAKSVAEWYAERNAEQAERLKQAHEQRMESHMGFVRSNPGMHNQQERDAAERYFAEKFRDKVQEDDDYYRRKELDTREKVAEFGYMGQRDAGKAAAELTAGATRYGADQTLKGIEAQAQRDRELQKGQLEFEKWRTGRTLDQQEAASRREWGELGPDGKYTPGGHGYVAKTQGEAQAAAAQQAQQSKLEQERIRAEAKIAAERMKGDARIKSAISGNALLAGRPEMAQQMLKTMIASGMNADEIAQVLGGAGGTGKGMATEERRIKEEMARRGI